MPALIVGRVAGARLQGVPGIIGSVEARGLREPWHHSIILIANTMDDLMSGRLSNWEPSMA